jgi:threonine synthase
MINVEDEEILEAMRYTGRLSGVFAEPPAAALAGVRRAVKEGEPCDVLPDGTGLEFILQSRGLLVAK